jgi:hypothetical protein
VTLRTALAEALATFAAWKRVSMEADGDVSDGRYSRPVMLMDEELFGSVESSGIDED